MAPELLEACANSRLLSALDRRPCDIFAFGCICYEVRVPVIVPNHELISFQMYNGVRPFWDMLPQAADVNFMMGTRPLRPTDSVCFQRGLDDDMWDFMQNLWHQNPKLRASAGQASLWMSCKMYTEGKSLDRPPAEMEWDLDFLTECTTELTDPLSLA
jgi:hypothetical protein